MMLRKAGADWKKGIPCNIRRRDSSHHHLRIREYEISCPPLAGRSLFFISDLHAQTKTAWSLPAFRHWSGLNWIRQVLYDAVGQCKPDYFVFGGDLTADACMIPEALELLRDLPGKMQKIAVPGNWDLRREWLNGDFWHKSYQEIGFHFLQNKGTLLDGIRFYGADDFKKGNPVFPQELPDAPFHCILFHNPDTFALLPLRLTQHNGMMLAGHTHGGQVRIPGFGALYGSTVVWKRFENGMYHSPRSNMPLLVSSGIGTSWFPIRVFCPPEAIHIHFTS
ncbi:MAG: metallophosphoesterase [Lentisphaeria bacterium]|nr:metallophosphoesterase [Lentisphaeria bacterium]MBR2435457.1 metallophosphoesterase [Lentisphaeria bacterium]